MEKDKEIITSWTINADAWSKTIAAKEIESRNLVTNQAIIDAVVSVSPKRILDLGCGEGWLSKEFVNRGFDTFGIDAIPALIDQAKSLSSARFDVCSYENLSQYPFEEKFDCVVCNFSLIGEQSTEQALIASAKVLLPTGNLIIQTLHPIMSCGENTYKDSWREGSWDGFSKEFTNPAPWYFRTLGGWVDLLIKPGFRIKKILEPLHPKTKKPASIIFQCAI